jgi:hypothetical protein
MQSGHIGKFNLHIFDDIEFLGLVAHLQSTASHTSFGCSYDASQDEEDEESVCEGVDPIEGCFYAGSSDIFVLDVPILCHFSKNIFKGEYLAIVILSVESACNLLIGNFFVSEIFLLDKLNIFERMHSKKFHEGLGMHFFLVAEVFD